MADPDDDRHQAVGARRKLRSELLLALYDAVAGVPEPYGSATIQTVAAALERQAADIETAFQFLEQSGYVKSIAMGGIIGLTTAGVIAVEEAIEPTDDPLAVIDAHELRLIEGWLGQAQQFIDDDPAGVDPDDLAQIRAQLDTIASQLRAPRPARRVLTWALRAVGAVLGGVAGNAATAGLVATLPHLR